MKKIVKSLLPPIFYSFLGLVYYKLRDLNKDYPPVDLYDKEQASWHNIKGGILKDRGFFVAERVGQSEMINGSYDSFFYNYLNRYDLNSKIIFEIGAHVGYHAMSFAELVGQSGVVHAFEPNSFNRDRFMSNLSKSPDLLKRIKVHNVAVSDSIGEIEFNFSGNIDDGSSSGSFITGSNTPESSLLYESIGFKKVNVQTVTLDELSSTMHIDDIPFLIKIDVEGAEHLVLEGGKKFIKQYKPIILLEIHSIFNMMKCYEFFSDLNYKLELLQQEPDGRCFIAATKD